MTTTLGGPTTGLCHVRSFTVACEDPFEARDEADLGVMPWPELVALIENAGGSRPAYDLFDLPAPDGTTVRYRAVDCEEQA